MTEGVDLDGLKACPNPWCNSTTVPLPVALKREGWRVACACGVTTHRHDTEAEAIAAWNTRAAPAEAELPTGASILAAERATRHIGGMMAALAVGYFAMCCYARPIGERP